MKHNRSNLTFFQRLFRVAVAYFFAMTPVHASDQCTPAEKAAQAAVQGMNNISPEMLSSISNMTGIMNGGTASGSKGGQLGAKAAQCMAQASKCLQTCQQQIQQGLQLMSNPVTMPKGKMMVQTGQKGQAKCSGEHMPKCQKGAEQAQSDQQHQQQAQQAQPSAQPGQQQQQPPSQQAQQQEGEEEEGPEEEEDEELVADGCPKGLQKNGENAEGQAICGCAEDEVMADGQQQVAGGETEYQCVPKEVAATRGDTSARTLNAENARTFSGETSGADTVVGDEMVSVPKSLLDGGSFSSSSPGAYQWRGLQSSEVKIAPVKAGAEGDGEQVYQDVDVSAAGGSAGSSPLSGVLPPPIGDESNPILMKKFGKPVKKGKKAAFVIEQPTHYMPTLEEAVKDMLTNEEGWSNPNEKVDHIVKLLKEKIDSGDVKKLCKIPMHIRELQLGIDYAKVKAAELNIYFEKRLAPLGGRVGLDVVCHQSLAGH